MMDNEGPRRSRALVRRGAPVVLVAPWLAWAVVRTFGLETDRLVPAMTFTPYVGATAAIPLVAALILRRWAVAAVALVVCVAFALALLPRALAGPQPDVDGPQIRVMTSNLYLGRGDARAIVALVREQRVDVLGLEEMTPEVLARLDAAGLRRLLPHRDADARAGANGSGLFSRFPLKRLKPYNSLDQNGEPRALVRVPGARAFEVQVVHPPPPINGQAPKWRHMLSELPTPDLGDASRVGGPLRMLIGDFNATLDHAELRELLGDGDGGYVDAADATGHGYRTTWPAGRRLPPEIAIDHVLIDPRVRADDVSVHLIPRSDHRAVIATLRVPRAR
jgi:endonuclease/exonuclease/phosphatase family metal-dependent hydrolase